MNKPNFTNWHTEIEIARLATRKIDSEAFSSLTHKYRKGMIANALFTKKKLDAAQISILSIEESWHRSGRPYFKLWPQITAMLAHTKLNFDGGSLRFPYDSFSIMTPSKKGKCTSFLCYGNQHVDKETVERNFNTFGEITELASRKEKWAQFKDKWGEKVRFLVVLARDLDGGLITTSFPFFENLTIEESIEQIEWSVADERRNSAPALGISWPEIKTVIRLAVGAAMFGVNRHELVCPDIDVELLKTKHPAGRSKASAELAAAEIQKEIDACRGWKIGSEIDLPRCSHSDNCYPPTGRELQYGHVRSGHMRMQPCGPENQERKLIFVPPTMVRPDLPAKQTHGYRIRDNILEAKRCTT